MTLLLHSLRSEFRKTKRTASWAFALFAALFVPAIFMLVGFGTDGVDPQTMKDPWRSMLSKGFMIFGGAVLPLFTILCATLLPQIEYRNDTWKQVRITPQSPLRLFTVKYLQLLLMVTLVLVLFNALLFVAAGYLQWREPAIALGKRSFDWAYWLRLNGNLFTSILGLVSVQFFLGIRFRNFLVPVGVGFLLWVLGMMLLFDLHSSIGGYIPHVYPLANTMADPESTWVMERAGSLAYFAVFLLAAFYDFKRRKF
ncbi:MAG: hypothetical protein EOO15_15925 [Chitinophagaceae bacterium]|nr:MAG: hypothetical protein EOO15_15925 [Chitinophagaceae bacterium]